MIPTPREIFARYESGAIERDELHALMARHARELIAEMEEDHRNPAAAWLETLLARRAADRLVRRHGSRLVREILLALADIPEFPAVRHLWNAAHPDVPLHCFLRMRREPVFRILSIDTAGGDVLLTIEYGEAAKSKGTRRRFVFRRDPQWKLQMAAD